MCQIAVGYLRMHQPQKILQPKYQLSRCLHSKGAQAAVLEGGVSWMIHFDGRALRGNLGQQYPPPPPLCMVQCTHLITTGGTPHLHNKRSSMQVNSLHSGANNI